MVRRVTRHRRGIRSGSNVSGADYVSMIELRRAAVAKAAEQFAAYDAIILPTTAVVAPVIDELAKDDELFARVNLHVLRNTTVFNLLDCPGLSLPIPDAGPLPVGLSNLQGFGEQLLHTRVVRKYPERVAPNARRGPLAQKGAQFSHLLL